MPETVASPHDAPTDQTGALDAGHTTTEYRLAKWAVYGGIALAVLSGIADVALQVSAVIPNPLITKIGMIAGALATTLASILYGKARTDLKRAALAAPPAAGNPKDVVTQ